MGDTYFFFNELVKAQATSKEENSIFIDYRLHKQKHDRFYGRLYAGACVVPYLITVLSRRSIMFKLGTGYLLYTCMDALYDMGVYTYFFLHGPTYMK